jgi:hypothetical protein
MRLLFIAMLFTSFIVSASTLIIPSKDKYGDFLIDPWKPNAANVIVFKDPNCGYCIRALKRLDKYKDYNVYMFWAPILGSSSKKQVEDIFECEKPSGEEVILSVINRSNITCKKATPGVNRLKALNREVVENYNPQSVPSYYFGGQKVWLSTLNRFKKMNDAETKPIKLDWIRYQELKLDQKGHQGLANAIVFVSNIKNKKSLRDRLKNDYRYNWYIAEHCTVCSELPANEKSKELALLFNIENQGDLSLVINGVKIQPERYSEFKLQSLLSSKTL